MPDKLLMTLALLAGAMLPAASQAQAAPKAQSQNAMTVVRDAETGKLRAPTAAEARALLGTKRARSAEAAPRSQTVVRPDGTRAVELGERGMVYSVVTKGADGKLARKCVKVSDAGEAMQHKGDGSHDHQ